MQGDRCDAVSDVYLPWCAAIRPTGSSRAQKPALATGLTSAVVTVTAGQRCAPQEFMRGSQLTVTEGSAELVGGRLTLRVRFRYARTDGSDAGSYAWEYTGAHR